jgi:hypothetical protein
MFRPSRFTNAIRVWAPRGILSTYNYILMAYGPMRCEVDRVELMAFVCLPSSNLALSITVRIHLACTSSCEIRT